MPRLLTLATLLLFSTIPLWSQTPAELPPPARTIELHEGAAPGSEKWDWEEYTYVTHYGNTVTRNVVKPTLQYYPADPDKACGTAVIVAPGGGFTDLMIKYEGVRTALALNAIGVDAFILKYRLIYTDPSDPLPVPGEPAPPRVKKFDFDTLQIIWGPQTDQNIGELANADTRRAITWLRKNAEEFGIKENHIGIIGFSAGAFVSLDLVMDEPKYRPGFAGVIYGPDNREKSIPTDAPPIFIAVSSDDTWSAPQAIKLYQAWREADRPTELHIFQTGGHGFLNYGGGADFFLDRFAEWMRANEWLPKGAEGNAATFR